MPEGTPIILVGGGGHALVVAEAAALAGFTLAGFLDDDAAAPLSRGNPSCPHLDPLSEMEAYAERGCIVAIGDLSARRGLIARLGKVGGASLVTVTHPRASLSPSAVIGDGVYIGPGAVVHTRAHIADHAIINSNAIVEHECRIADNVHIAPGAAIGGRVTIGRDSLIGLGARVMPNITIGEGCIVGAGATVIRNVPDHARLVGTPAMPI